MTRDQITREEFEMLVDDGETNDANAGGDPATREEYVRRYLEAQYEVYPL